MAGRAWDCDGVRDDSGSPGHDHLFFRIQRFEILHEAGIVFDLRELAHAAQDHHHVRKGCSETDRPGCRRSIGRMLLEYGFDLRRDTCKRTTFDRLHDDHLPAVFLAQFITLTGFDGRRIPIDIVDLKLDMRHLGMFLEDSLQGR